MDKGKREGERNRGTEGGRNGGREGKREKGMEEGTEGGRDEVREEQMEGGKEGGGEGVREGGNEGGRELTSSNPMMPAPMTTILSGTESRERAPVEDMTLFSSN